jgi:hypothetical protein
MAMLTMTIAISRRQSKQSNQDRSVKSIRA